MNALSKARAPRAFAPQLKEQTNTLLDRALELGAMPSSTQSLLALTRSDSADLGPVVDALALNPNLAAAVLRVANSAAYGQARSIANLRRAVSVVGMQELHDLVAGTAMMAAFSRPHPLSERLQATAVLSGSLAQKLSIKLRVGSPSTAYLSGLMCEIGALACLALDPDYPALFLACEGDAKARFEAESTRYGGTTPVIGARILSMSMLPSVVTDAVATTGFEAQQDEKSLGSLVAFARLAAFILVRAAEHGDPVRMQDELMALAESVGLTQLAPERLTRVCLQAAANAELTLRGELGLAQMASVTQVDAMSHNVKAHASRRELYYVAAAVAAGATLATTLWLLRS